MPATAPAPLSEAERRALRSVTRATPQPVNTRCEACGGPQNPQTGECRGCSD